MPTNLLVSYTNWFYYETNVFFYSKLKDERGLRATGYFKRKWSPNLKEGLDYSQDLILNFFKFS